MTHRRNKRNPASRQKARTDFWKLSSDVYTRSLARVYLEYKTHPWFLLAGKNRGETKKTSPVEYSVYTDTMLQRSLAPSPRLLEPADEVTPLNALMKPSDWLTEHSGKSAKQKGSALIGYSQVLKELNDPLERPCFYNKRTTQPSSLNIYLTCVRDNTIMV